MKQFKFDLHIHSKYSKDSFTPIERIIKYSNKIGLNGISITDHNTIKGSIEAKRINKSDLKIIIGSEIELNNGGELIGLFLKEEVKKGSFIEVYEQIKNQGGITILPHPFRESKKIIDKLNKDELMKIDIIEGINGFNYPSENKSAIEYANKYSKIICGGSDSHHYSTIGKAYTIFENTYDLKKQLILGKIKYGGGSISKKDRSRIFINRNLKSKNYKEIFNYNYIKLRERLK